MLGCRESGIIGLNLEWRNTKMVEWVIRILLCFIPAAMVSAYLHFLMPALDSGYLVMVGVGGFVIMLLCTIEDVYKEREQDGPSKED